MYRKIAVFFLLFIITGQIYAQCTKSIVYVGTYSGKGLYQFEFNQATEEMTQIHKYDDIKDPKFQAQAPNGNYLYSISNKAFSRSNNDGTILSYKVNEETGTLKLLNKRPVLGRGPAHISVDPKGRFVYVSNFSSGNLSVFAINEDGSLTEAVDSIQHRGSSINKQRQSGPHVHSTIPSNDGRFIYVSDMGTDKINIYKVNQRTGKLSPAKMRYVDTKPGSGPRDFTMHPNSNFAYSLEQMGSFITIFQVDSLTGGLRQIQRISTLPTSFDDNNQAADIHISPDGEFLYASNRGHDSLVIYKINVSTGFLSLVGFEATRGQRPRHFMIDRKGKFLLVANRKENNITVFRRDKVTGKLHFMRVKVKIPEPGTLTQSLLN